MKVLTDHPLKQILQKQDTLGPLAKWAIELSEFDIEYLPCTAVKGQVLADFMVEFTGFPEEVSPTPQGKSWQVYVNGSPCHASRGVGVHIVTD